MCIINALGLVLLIFALLVLLSVNHCAQRVGQALTIYHMHH